jgi:hypothetical protein
MSNRRNTRQRNAARTFRNKFDDDDADYFSDVSSERADNNTALGAYSSTATLEIESLTSINVKNVTSKSGVTQPAHHVVKSAAVALVVRARSADVDLQQHVVQCSLVYDAPSTPMPPVAFPTKKKLLSYSAHVEPRRAALTLRLGLLSSQVEGALFRIRIDVASRAEPSSCTTTLYTPPIVVVSKPYLALRKEGQRGKPLEMRRTSSSSSPSPSTTRQSYQKKQQTAPSTALVPMSNNVVGSGGDGEKAALAAALYNLQREQVAQRQMLEQLLAQQQQQRGSKRGLKRNHDAADDDDEEYIPGGDAKRARAAEKAPRVVMTSPVAPTTTSDDEEWSHQHNNDDDDGNGVDVAAAALTRAHKLDPLRATQRFVDALPPALRLTLPLVLQQQQQQRSDQQVLPLSLVEQAQQQHEQLQQSPQHSASSPFSDDYSEHHNNNANALKIEQSSPALYSDEELASVDFGHCDNALFLSSGIDAVAASLFASHGFN